ncbi:hypothetical protein AB0J63_46190, partial [Streptosporangium canum]|uniref:hypothetical protein n=1 Tax=Streptosporangium canum TaxID=324952 RepID=UPI00342B8D8F
MVNPRFPAKLQHAFTKGKVTDPVSQGTTPGLLEIHLPEPADLQRMIVDTVQHHLQDYDWSDSIAHTGVQEALVAMTMRVHDADGRSETIVVVIDGQFRLVSAWRNILSIPSGTKLTKAQALEYAQKIAGRMFCARCGGAVPQDGQRRPTDRLDPRLVPGPLRAAHIRATLIATLINTFKHDTVVYMTTVSKEINSGEGSPRHVDVLIIGAGLSGIGAAWRLQQRRDRT